MPRHGGRGTAWDRFRLRMLDRDSYRCQTCGKWGNEVDHIKPLQFGGAMFDPANCQTLCRGCHIRKTRAENSRPNPEREAWGRYMLKMNT